MTGLRDANTSFGVNPAQRVDWSLPTLLGILEENGVERALTISLRGRYHDAAAGNDETLAACQAHPLLLPVATLDPRRYLGYEDEIARRTDAGFVAFRFFPDHQGWPLDWLPFLEIAEAVARTGLPMILPAGVAGTITAAGRLLAPMGLRVLFLGAGYGIMSEVLAALQVHPTFCFDTHLMDTPLAIETLCQYGGDRILFGSNAPERYLESARNMLDTAELTPDQRAAVSGGNLRLFLGEGREVWV